MDCIVKLDKKVQVMKVNGAQAADELIRTRFRYQREKSRHQLLTEQVACFIRHSQSLEQQISSTQDEITRLRQHLLSCDTNREYFQAESYRPRTASVHRTSTFGSALDDMCLSTVQNPAKRGYSNGRPLSTGRVNGEDSRGVFCENTVPKFCTVPYNMTNLSQSCYGHFSDSSLHSNSSSSYSNLSIGSEFNSSFTQPVLLAPSLTPSVSMTPPPPPPQSFQSRSNGLSHHQTVLERPPFESGEGGGALENVLEGPDHYPTGDSNCLTLSELFATEFEQMSEHRSKQYRKNN